MYSYTHVWYEFLVKYGGRLWYEFLVKYGSLSVKNFF